MTTIRIGSGSQSTSTSKPTSINVGSLKDGATTTSKLMASRKPCNCGKK